MARIFGHYVPKYLMVLGVVELVCLYSSVFIGVFLRFFGFPTDEALHPDVLWPKALSYSLVCFFTLIAMGLYQRDLRDNYTQVLFRLFLSFAVALSLLVLFFYLVPDLFIGRGALALALLTALLLLALSRWLAFALTSRATLKKKVIILGAGNKSTEILKLRRKTDWQEYALLGFLPIASEPVTINDARLLSTDKGIFGWVKGLGADEVVVSNEGNLDAGDIKELVECKMAGVRVTPLGEFYERLTGKVSVDIIAGHRMVFLDGFHRSPFRRTSKRMFDILTSSGLLLLAVPVMLITAILIKRESGWRSPVIYSQCRVGKNDQPFTIYKFRSMVENAETNGAQWASREDARITRVGHFIRKTRVDELPQLWNVLRGDMSFVGPRPERPEFVAELNQEIPFYDMRHRVKPGITGWAQVRYPYGDNYEAARQKLQFDLYYIKNYSTFLDFNILLQTAQVILFQKGSR